MGHLYRYLDTVGDGSGDDNFIGDYDGNAEEALIIPPEEEVFFLHRMIITIEDTAGMAATDYGNIAGGITNGITMHVDDDDETLLDITGGVAIKSNAEWGRLCYDVTRKTWSTGPELLLVRFTFDKSGAPLELWGSNGHKLVVHMSDNLSGLTGHRFMVQGQTKTI